MKIQQKVKQLHWSQTFSIANLCETMETVATNIIGHYSVQLIGIHLRCEYIYNIYEFQKDHTKNEGAMVVTNSVD